MPKHKILIVEDNPKFSLDLKRFFVEKGLQLVPEGIHAMVDNYDDAIRIAKAELPSIALLDIMLNDNSRDGIDLGIWIHEHLGIPIIFLSSEDNLDTLIRIAKYPDMRFFAKADTGEKMNSLWFYVQSLLLHTKSIPTNGQFFKVKKMSLAYFTKENKEAYAKIHGQAAEIKLFIPYENIKKITAINDPANWGKNILRIDDADDIHCYLLLESLSEMEENLPIKDFNRISGSVIVNMNHIDDFGNKEGTFNMHIWDVDKKEISPKQIKVSKDFKGRELAVDKLHQFIKRKSVG